MTDAAAASVHVHRDELPISCPPEKSKWNLHPRVYLPVPAGATEVHCQYCGTRYVIVDDPDYAKPQEGRQG